jgi:hypothetical protein
LSRFPKPCPTCSTLYKSDKDYCPTCQEARDEKRKKATPTRVYSPERKLKKRHLYGGDYLPRAKLVRATATYCHICKQPFKPDDVIHADHLIPELGSASPLAAAHKRCNESRGNKPLPYA